VHTTIGCTGDGSVEGEGSGVGIVVAADGQLILSIYE